MILHPPEIIDRQAEIKITDHTTNVEETIEQKTHDQAHKTLGMYLSPQGDNKAGIQHIGKKIETLAKQIAANTITPQEANIAHDVIYTVKMKYGMHVIPADEKTIDKLQTKMVKAMLPAMGFNQNMAKEIIHGTYKAGGVGF